MENIQVGAYGWNNSSWQGNFYPEDLPEDWHLDYYANLYRTLLVPEDEWLSWDDAAIEEVLGAIEGEFNFFFEFSVNNAINEALLTEYVGKISHIRKLFATQFAGLVMLENSHEPFAQELQNKLIAWAEKLHSFKVTLVSPHYSIGKWRWQYGDNICSGAPCGVLDKLTSDAKQQTALMRDFEASLPEKQKATALIIRDPDLDMNQLNNLKVISELLGF